MMKSRYWVSVVAICAMTFAVSCPGAVRLHGLLTEHMVLQQARPIPIWGWADPGEPVKVRFADQVREANAGTDGKWKVEFKPVAAGGPFTLTVSGAKDTIEFKDVLVGEVWVASGQSNMEWWVGVSRDPEKEIAAANHPQIRHIKIPHNPVGSPIEDVSASWQVCEPGTVAGFTAAGYYFARFLNQELKVPVGIINSSFGGTCAEAWTPLAALKADKINLGMVNAYEKSQPVYDKLMEQYQAAAARHAKRVKEGKLLERQADPGNRGFEQGWARSDCKDADWKTVELPQFLDAELGGDGAIWVRREVTIPESWVGQPVTLNLGGIDDHDATYWNGTLVGETNAKTNPTDWYLHRRKYTVPADQVKAGRTVLAVRVFDDLMTGGFGDIPEAMFIECDKTHEKIPLAGPWRYKVEVSLDPANLSRGPSAPLGPKDPNAPGTLYNGMIHPLRRYPIRGAIWYQGESNAGQSAEYVPLMATLIRQWRQAWNQPDFPFGIVQLANYMAVQPDPNAGSAWAGLRESQFKISQTVNNVGLALAVDIGDAVNIHPSNKQAVGRRLGLWAMAKVYGHPVIYSGPVYKSMKIEGNRIRLAFDHVGSGLVAKGDSLKGFAVAGPDKKFVWAQATIDGDTVLVGSEKVPNPVTVRYAWSDNPSCNLYNKENLPAVPFRTGE